jgi:hypothetical protein
MRPLLPALLVVCLAAAEPPPVPDPFGLGERLALIEALQTTYRVRPAPEATVEALREAYARAWLQAQAGPATDTIPDAPDEAAQSAVRRQRLRERIASRHRVDADAGLSEADLGVLLRRLDGERAERDAAAIAALVAGERARAVDAKPAPPAAPAAGSPPIPEPPLAPAALAAPRLKAREIAFTASGVSGSLLVEDAGISALLVAFGTDHNGAFSGLPEAMIAALRGSPGIRRAVLLLGHGTGNTIAGEPIEKHLKANRAFYETLGNTAAAQPVECLVFASCSAGNPNQMMAMRDGLGYYPTWRVATAARSFANAPTVLAALRATAARPAAPAWRGLFRLPAADGDVGCFGEVGVGGERATTLFYRVLRAADGSWKVEEQR